jgi:hypothetical protein
VSVDPRSTGLARGVRPFDAVVSPYHLTTREPAALVALQVAQSATTLLLAPQRLGADERAVREAAVRSPVYRAYMRSWEWAMPLFREGLLGSVDGGEDPADDVRDACHRLQHDDACAPLTPFLRHGLFEDEEVYLQTASADVLKAGPDPGVSIPIAAGLDAFASAREMIVARSAATSVVQKAESRLGRVVFRTSVPALVQASAERVLLVRALLGEARERLAREIAAAFETGNPAPLRAASVAYADAFERERAHITSPPGPGEEDEVRVIVGEASLVGMELSRDAVLRSSVAAATGRAPSGFGEAGFVRTILIRSVGGR